MLREFDAVYFDMDGTLVDLYGYDDWENLLNSENIEPYRSAAPLVDMNQLNAILTLLKTFGVTIGVISWCAMHGSNRYNRNTRKAKKQWLDRYLPCVDELHVVKYGTPKYKVAKVKNSILVDDSPMVRNSWNGTTIDASNSEEMMESLMKLLAAMLNK